VFVVGARNARLNCQLDLRSDLKPARTSSERSCGCSHAATQGRRARAESSENSKANRIETMKGRIWTNLFGGSKKNIEENSEK
jgi:hypothetical protein